MTKTLAALLVALLPVAAQASYLGNIEFATASPAQLPLGAMVTVSFDYKIDTAEGVRIWAVPHTLDQPTPDATAIPVGVMGAGAGSSTRSFYVSAPATVTHVQLSMESALSGDTLLEIFLPVHYVYDEAGIFDVEGSHPAGSRIRYGENLDLSLGYDSGQSKNVQIVILPFTDGELTPGYVADDAPVRPAAGSCNQGFTFNAEAHITDIRVQIRDSVLQRVVYAEFFIPYEAWWAPVGVTTLVPRQPQGSLVPYGERVFADSVLEPHPDGTTRFWAEALSAGQVIPNTKWSEFTGGGEVAFQVGMLGSSGSVPVDGFRVSALLPDGTTYAFDLPVDYTWTAEALWNMTFTPAAPAVMSADEHLEMVFDYATDAASGITIAANPVRDGAPLFCDHADPVVYAGPDGSATYWVRGLSSPPMEGVLCRMVDAATGSDRMQHFYSGIHVWGVSAAITPVPEETPNAAAYLGRSYPNPFNPVAMVPVTLARDGNVDLAVYDVKGRLVSVLHRGPLAAGRHDFTFKGDGEASGTYFCRLRTAAGVQSQAMMLVK